MQAKTKNTNETTGTWPVSLVWAASIVQFGFIKSKTEN